MSTITEERVGTDNDLMTFVTEKPDVPEICEAIDQGDDCRNEADYICEVWCCKHRICLCEDCFLEFHKRVKAFIGTPATCNFCNVRFTLDGSHLYIVEKLR